LKRVSEEFSNLVVISKEQAKSFEFNFFIKYETENCKKA
jgi:hypothetical protein